MAAGTLALCGMKAGSGVWKQAILYAIPHIPATRRRSMHGCVAGPDLRRMIQLLVIRRLPTAQLVPKTDRTSRLVTLLRIRKGMIKRGQLSISLKLQKLLASQIKCNMRILVPTFSYRLLFYTVLGTVACDLLLTAGFMLLRIPPAGFGIPINQIVLVTALSLILISGRSTFRITETLPFALLYCLWVLAAAQLFVGVRTTGAWAVRDAANMIETGFFFVGFCLAADSRFLTSFRKWVAATFLAAAIYLLLYPVRDNLAPFSPSISSMSGYQLPLFFHFGNPASIGVTSICYLLLMKGWSTPIRLALAGAVVMCLLVFVQARITYLHLIFLVILFAIFERRQLKNLFLMGSIALLLIALFVMSGIQLPGRLGHTFSFDLLISHFQAIWGGGGQQTRDAAEGVDLRLSWWIEIHHNLLRNLQTWFFGLGYGMPLTSFRGISDDIVREPHNSYISIYGRLGVLGITLFLLYLATILRETIRLIELSRRTGATDLYVIAMTLFCFFGVHIIYAVAEGGFEVSFIAVPFYTFSGIVVAMRQNVANELRLSERTRLPPLPLTV